MTDSTGWIYDAEGIDLDAVKEIKEVKTRAVFLQYTWNYRPNAVYTEGKGVWTAPSAMLLCLAQHRTSCTWKMQRCWLQTAANCCGQRAQICQPPLEATEVPARMHGVLFAPGKASNAGGVATSALEMSQNSQRLSWTFEEVDQKLKTIMENIFAQADAAAEKYGHPRNYVMGANIAGFTKVADTMLAQGVV